LLETPNGNSVRGVLKAVVCFLALSTDLLSPIHQDLGNLGPRLMAPKIGARHMTNAASSFLNASPNEPLTIVQAGSSLVSSNAEGINTR